jgi:hypothetical protein
MGWNLAGAPRKKFSDEPEFSPFLRLSEPFFIQNSIFQGKPV